MAKLKILTSTDPQPDYLALPLDTPLADWDDPSIVRIPVGVHRHVVRFVTHADRLVALKELPPRLAAREWDNLQFLRKSELPVVDLLGVITDRGDQLDDILITRHLEYSLPYRTLFTGEGSARLTEDLINALAILLVRLHLVGFWWGDCSLSNTLFRRDAGSLSAWIVDTETSERQPALSDGQRQLELDIAQVNILGGLLDLEAQGRLPRGTDPDATVQSLVARYEALWNELTEVEAMPATERHRIDARLRRLNDLGFDTTEIYLDTSGTENQLVFRPAVVEAGHHGRLLLRLTGIEAAEGQARHLLNDIRSYGAWLSGREGRNLPEAVAAYRWLTDVYEPALEAVPVELRDRREAPEMAHEILAHRDAMERASGESVSVADAAVNYAVTALPSTDTERTVLDVDEEA